MLKLIHSATDEPIFVDLVAGSARGVIRHASPAELRVIKLNNWFGPRWFCFSHKTLGALGIRTKQPKVVPPFVPSRIVSEQVWRRKGVSYQPSSPSRQTHVRQHSDENPERRLAELFSDTAFVWWSGNTRPNGRGAIMAYWPEPDRYVGWYVQLTRSQAGWQPEQLLEIGPEEFRTLVQEAD